MNRFSSGPSRLVAPELHQDGSAHRQPGLEQEAVLHGGSVAVRRLRSQVERIAPYLRTALLCGEPGTGKRQLARAIHALSSGAERPFLELQSAELAEVIGEGKAVLPEGAPDSRTLLESVAGGTLYLGRVDELGPMEQAGLMRFLRSFEERRLAISRPSDRVRPDTRVLASTVRDLRTLASIGQYRQDVYARLSVVEIAVPSLQQRREDIPALAEFLLRRLAAQTGTRPKMLAPSTLAQLDGRPWPNNLQELERVLAQAALLAEGAVIEPRHLLALVEPRTHALPAASAQPKIERLDDVIQQHVLHVLTHCGGNKLRAAELLGISRSTLYRMLDAASVSGRMVP
jgi:DNA-binding NtrC family response regulator